MKRIIYNTIFLATAVALTSCNDFLDAVPDNRTEINTVEKVAQLVTSSYLDATYAVMFNARVDYVSDKGAGDYAENLANTDSFYWRDVTDTQQDSPEYLWRRGYEGIAAANHAIEAAAKIADPAADPYVAEAKLSRALSHFVLAASFAQMYEPGAANDAPGVPYVTEPETEVIKMYDRSTVAKTYEAIEKDIVEGIEGLDKSVIYSAPAYHFSKEAAHALATRFYLFKGDYDKVIEHVNEVFPQPSVFTASGNVATSDAATLHAKANFQPWTTTYDVAISSNDIKAFYTRSDNPSNLLLCEMSSRMARYANSWRYATKESDIKSTVYCTTPVGGEWGYHYYYAGDSYYLPKYREHFVYTSVNATTGFIYTIFPYFRQEELLLSRAEAYALTDRLDEALADMNVFMRQRTESYNESDHVATLDKLTTYYAKTLENPENYMSKYNAYGSAAWSNEKKALVMFILDCRRNEFMWEGLRYWDMWRYKMTINHKDSYGEKNSLYPGDDRWLLQIPETAKLSGVELNPRENLLSPKW